MTGMVWGVPIEIRLQFEDGPHDITHLLELDVEAARWHLDADTLLNEISVEQRARLRAKEKAACD